MSALPNLFNFIIDEALGEDRATPESVASAIAASTPFVKAVEQGFAHVPPAGIERPTKAEFMRSALAQAFSAATAGQMFD